VAREQKFQLAKAAAEQRAATTLSAADASAADFKDGAVRRSGTRTFALVNGSWTDTQYTATMKTVRVKPYSAAYFALLQRIEDLRAPFAWMGADGTPGVIVAGRAVAIVLANDGVDALAGREITAIEGAW
jgi:hypothetical protein